MSDTVAMLMCARLSAEEATAIERVVSRCRAEEDLLIREIGVVYLRGMCDILCVQERLSQEEAEKLIARVKPQ